MKPVSRTAFRDLQQYQKDAITNRNKAFDKTKLGFLSRLYKNMRGRTEGIQKLKKHLYFGLYLLPRDQFYSWSLSDACFNELFDTWTQSNYDRKLTPSVDRIDSKKGYEITNIRWLTHSKNSQNGANSRWQNQ